MSHAALNRFRQILKHVRRDQEDQSGSPILTTRIGLAGTSGRQKPEGAMD
jgi:hypothetical protein